MDIMTYIKNSIGFYFGNPNSYEYVEKKVSLKDAGFVYLGLVIVATLLKMIVESIYTQVPNFWLKSILSLVLSILIILPISLGIIYGLLYLFLKLFGGKQNFANTLKFGLSLSIFTIFVYTLLNLIPTRFFSDGSTGGFNYLLLFNIILGIITLIFLIWGFVVSIRVYSRLHSLSTGKTILSIIMPFLIMFIIGIILGVFLTIFRSLH